MTNDTPITLTRLDLCNLALACTNAWAQSNANKWVHLHDTIMAEIIAAEAEQQPTETENAPQAAPQAAEGTARQAEDITAAIIGAIGTPAPAQTITATIIGPDGTPYRATYTADLLDSLRTEARVLDIQDDETGELVYIKPDPAQDATHAPAHTTYHIKPEYYDMWNAWDGNDTVTGEQIEEMAREWEKLISDLMEQVTPAEEPDTADDAAETETAEDPEPREWYAVMMDRDDDDWGTGSWDRADAMRQLQSARADGHSAAYIAVITGDVCTDEII